MGTIASLYLPSLNADIIDNGVVTGDTDYIIQVGLVMLAVSLLQVACTIVAVYFGAKTAMGFGRDLRSSIFSHVAAFSGKEMAGFGAPSLITRNTNDVQQVQMLVLMGLHHDGDGTDHDGGRCDHGPPRGHRAGLAGGGGGPRVGCLRSGSSSPG